MADTMATISNDERTKKKALYSRRQASKIKPGIKAHLMFNETDMTGPDTKFGQAVTEMFELTGQKDNYCHYYMTREAFNKKRFMTEVMPMVESVCIPSRMMTWKEFEGRFSEFVGGTCEACDLGSTWSVTILSLKRVKYGNEWVLWLSVPKDQIPKTAKFDPFTYKGKRYDSENGFCIAYESCRDGSEDLGLTPFDEHEGTVVLSKINVRIVLHPPHHQAYNSKMT